MWWRHGLAFILVIVFAILLLVPVGWWIFKGFSVFQSFDIATTGKVSTSSDEVYYPNVTPENTRPNKQTAKTHLNP